MKPIKCTLHVNTRWGHSCVPREFNSIAQAVREGKMSPGFWWRVIANGKEVRHGYCDDM